jgi:hypothetical protein
MRRARRSGGVDRGGGAGRRRQVWGGCLGVEDPVGTNTDEDLGAGVGQVGGKPDGVVAGVEDEYRDRPAGFEPGDEVFYLGGGDGPGVLVGVDAAHVYGRGPGVVLPVELGDEAVVPAGHDGFAGGVTRRVVVEAAFGAAFGVAARPAGAVDGEHCRPVEGA